MCSRGSLASALQVKVRTRAAKNNRQLLQQPHAHLQPLPTQPVGPRPAQPQPECPAGPHGLPGLAGPDPRAGPPPRKAIHSSCGPKTRDHLLGTGLRVTQGCAQSQTAGCVRQSMGQGEDSLSPRRAGSAVSAGGAC